ncbi:MAG: hypothetical protein COA57_11810 [Flavobacteriales bacterium]|nr:MAG: hypothetical protein COA57_11810 [Flavobacteriales bacterium]
MKRITLFINCLFIAALSKGQLTVDFTTDTVCYGSITQLSDQITTSDSIISELWDLTGNGQFNNAMGAVVNYQFGKADTFNVGLQVITDAGDTGTAYKSVIVLAQPVAAYTPTNVCLGNANVFVNQSTISSGTITYSWDFGDSSTDTAQYPQHTYATIGTSNTQLIVTADNGCIDTTTSTATVYSLPQVAIILAGNSLICDQDSTILIASTNASSFFWSTGDSGDTLEIGSADWYFLVATDDNACVSRDSVEIAALVAPTISVIPDTFVVKGSSIQLYASGGTGYTWSPSASLDNASSETPMASPTEKTTYTVKGTGSNGCSVEKTVVVDVKDDYWVDATNMITPNGDGMNDVWKVRNIGMFPDCKFLIFNKWGDAVYESTGYQNDWGGTYNGNPLPEDTYYYIIKCDNEANSFSGAITLVR